MGNHTDPCRPTPFPNNLPVMKNSHCQQFMPNLCYIIYIYWGLWFTDNFNDSCLIQFVLNWTKMMGEWQTHL